MSRKADNSLGGIKLCFQDGSESPQFDVNYDSKELTTHNLKDTPIKSVTCRVNPCDSGTYINHIKFTYADDTESDIFTQSGTHGNLKTINIPDKHVIVGMYASKKTTDSYKRIHSVGFILMNLSKQ